MNFGLFKFEKKYFRFEKKIENYTIAYNSPTGRSCVNLKVIRFFLREISSRGAIVQKYPKCNAL